MATIQEFILSLDKRVNDLKTFTEPLRTAAFTVTAQMGRRIFDEGKKTDGSGISNSYSTKPMYVNPDKLFKKTGLGVPMGKNGDTKFKTGKKKGQRHKTKYLEGGYEELRSKLGRRIDLVDLNFSAELRLDFSNQKEIAEPRKISDFEYQIKLDKSINQDKREGMEEKYGEIFSLSDPEREKFFETMGFEFRKRLSTGK